MGQGTIEVFEIRISSKLGKIVIVTVLFDTEFGIIPNRFRKKKMEKKKVNFPKI